MRKNSKIITILMIIVIILISLSLIFSSCKRRARIAEALRDRETESTEDEAAEEDNGEEETVSVDEEEMQSEEDSETEDSDAEEDVSDNGSSEEEETEEEIVEEDEVVEEEEESESVEQYTSEIPFVSSECGNVIGGTAYSDPVIYPGDNGSEDLEVRGFVSFDISGLAGATVVEADISVNADNLFGTPFNTYGPLLTKAVYWGPRGITPSDYDLDGVELRNVTSKNFGIQNQNLKEDLQRAIDSGSGRYQLMFYFEMNGTDGDGEADNITYYLDQMVFTVTYDQ